MRLAGERRAQQIRRLVDGATRGGHVQRDEITDRAEIARRSDRHAGADQLPDAGLAPATQQVVLV